MPRHRARSTALRLAGAGVTLPALPRQSEASFMAQVVAYAKLRGWHAYHTYSSRRSEPGFPDLVLVRRPRVLFIECKAVGGYLSASQAAWLDELDACGQVTCVWRPADWPSIEHALA